MTELSETINDFDVIRTQLIADRPGTIQRKVAAWAFEDAEGIQDVLRHLESIDCAGCFSPAPIWYGEMAAEIAEHWSEIDEALDDYRDATGEAWTPKAGSSFLNTVWFAYEWIAGQLAGELRAALDR